jgi:outer membrane lipoprotein SlyB
LEASGFGGSENIGLSTGRSRARSFRMQGEHSMKCLIIAATVLATLAACTTTSPDVINRNEAQRLSNVQDGVILSLRPVVVEGSQSGIGSVAGGVVGGMAGGSVGGRRDSVVGGVVGAVVGGMVGNAVERFGTREEAVEILIQLKNGERRSVVQAKAGETLNPGDSVILVSTGGKVRVTRAPTVTPTQAPRT